MPQVKICGITRPQDALAAVKAGANAIGLQFFEQSVRGVTVEQAIQIRKQIPPFVSVVGVFVNAEMDTILQAAEAVRLDYVQLHGDETQNFIKHLPIRTIKTVRIGSATDLELIDGYQADVLLLDTKVGDQYGGTGKSFDWSLLDGFTSSMPLMLAGGLHSGNIVDAIRATKPKIVDLCSGVESAPSIKSFSKMREFIEIVRTINLNS